MMGAVSGSDLTVTVSTAAGVVSLDAERGSASRAQMRFAAEATAKDLLVAREPIVGVSFDDVERVFGDLLPPERADAQSLDLTRAGRRRRWPTRGVRHFLREQEGSGYWDFFMPTAHLTVSITDATYRKEAWVRVEGTGYFKLRLLLSGELRSASGALLVRAPQAMMLVAPGPGSEGYYIAPGQHTRMVVLHCRPALLTDLLGLDPSEVPAPLDALFAAGRPAERHRVSLGPDIAHAAQRIVDSRHQLPHALRGPQLEALGMEILTQVMGDFANQELVRRSASTLVARDLNRIYEARDYLAQRYVKPPSIPELARLVGINQTKLKAGFREVIGATIFRYVLQLRMQRAAELLLTREYNVAEVAYKVGYDYPANFTHAFKRFYGHLPRGWSQRT